MLGSSLRCRWHHIIIIIIIIALSVVTVIVIVVFEAWDHLQTIRPLYEAVRGALLDHLGGRGML